ncbi:uncharacterized protein DEA37_0004840 [Paragonimus westermani]|uniref:HMG box domain-containing protein n=1 Tax=Paragonimus westermani TaxID=34504 RepID=A0A5J4N9K8_9TREM|nr:uncharacterized protein DEA37_0004840 [Paragonimus westermani]
MRRTPQDKNAPKKPPTAFMLFMKQRRLQSKHLASLSFGERNRAVGAEWGALTFEEKAVFFDQAKEEREKYSQLFTEYKKSDAYKAWLASTENTETKGKKSNGKSGKRSLSSDASGTVQPDFKVPIFTHEFLEYNRLREAILRQLKKQAAQLEEETALLSKHVDNLVNAEARTKAQLQASEEQFATDEQLLKRLHKELVASLHEIAVPYASANPTAKSTEHITETSVESFLSQLGLLHKSQMNVDVTNKAIQSLRVAISKKMLKLLII